MTILAGKIYKTIISELDSNKNARERVLYFMSVDSAKDEEIYLSMQLSFYMGDYTNIFTTV